MSATTPPEFIRMQGNWSIYDIAQQAPRLRAASEALGMRQAGVAGPYPMVCLAEVGEIDTSGWQLLVLWLRQLKAQGLSPALVNVREELRESLEFLGFGGECPLFGGEGRA